MEVYFEAMKFVSILLDFSKNKMYTEGFNKGLARTWFLVLMKSALPEQHAIVFDFKNSHSVLEVNIFGEASFSQVIRY